MTSKCLSILVCSLLLVGCRSAQEAFYQTFAPPEIRRMNDALEIRYCGPDGANNYQMDRVSFNLDRLCGKDLIQFTSNTDTSYPPTKISEVPIFKHIVHFGDKTKVIKDEAPKRLFVIIGTLEFPQRWYYNSVVDEWMKEKVAEVGGHAILRYDVYEYGVLTRPHEVTGQQLDAIHMKLKAEIIRFTDYSMTTG